MESKLPQKIAQLIPVIEEGLLDLFEIHKKDINSLSESVDAISFDIIPSTYQEYFAISFRQDKDYVDQDSFIEDISLRYSPADWKYYNFLDYRKSSSAKFKNAAATVFGVFKEPYESVEEYDEIQMDINHLIFIAAAEALLKPSIAQKLKECGIGTAPILSSSPDGYSFEYLVTDEDRTFNFNYCEHIIANRMTNEIANKLNL